MLKLLICHYILLESVFHNPEIMTEIERNISDLAFNTHSATVGISEGYQYSYNVSVCIMFLAFAATCSKTEDKSPV